MSILNLSILSKLTQPTKKNVKRVSIASRRFHSLTVFGLAGYIRTRQMISFWICRCDCGNWTIVARPKLQKGYSKSCGCFRIINGEINRTHGMSKSRVYNIWTWIYTRCYNPNDSSYPNYGGRGIEICERWRSFENFLADMGDPPSSKHSIDRIDVNGNYEPTNCRWATPIEQARNKRNNHFVTANSETRCLAEWAEVTGLKQGLIARRLRDGWSSDEALEFKERSKPLQLR